MGHIQISNEFFKKERNTYSEWPIAFWRELVQNSVDAGANHLNISIDKIDEEHTIVQFDDDGCGFNSEVRDNIFFFLGKTNKDKNSIGGFGKARIVVCFSQHNYQIISQDWKCTGNGSSYEVDSNPYYNGCSVIIDVDTTGFINTMETYLYRYLWTTHLSCEITINGLKFTEWCYKRRLAKRLSFGSVYTNKNGKYTGYLIARVSGVTMFKRYICNQGVQVVLEIDPIKSREVLLSNRDSLHQEFQDELDKFIQHLAVDTKSALINNYKKFYFLQGDPKITRRKRKEKIEIFEPVAADWIKLPAFTKTEPPKSEDTSPIDIEFVDMNYRLDAIIPSAVVISETRNPKVRRVISRYNPANWENGGGNRKKLLRQWATVCDFVVGEYLDFSDKDELSWRPGFVFSDDAEAMYYINQNVACFLLNPVDKDGKISYGLRKKASWIRMIVRACHEVTHYMEEYHNESFVGVSENLIEKSICNSSRIFKSLLETLKVRM